MGELSEDLPAEFMDGVGEPPKPRNESVRINSDLTVGTLAAGARYNVPGNQQTGTTFRQLEYNAISSSVTSLVVHIVSEVAARIKRFRSATLPIYPGAR